MPRALATDLYQLTMMAGYHVLGDDEPRSFEMFVRHLPPHRSYLVAAGLEQALSYLETLRFRSEEIEWLRSAPALARVPASFFDELLAEFRFTGEVWAVEEGEPVFANEPLLRVTAPAPQAQLVETALLAIITQQTSVASKAARVVHSANGRAVIEFGSRRAPGLDAALHAARAACLAGCVATSNVEAGLRFGVPISGTMAHSWVMGFGDELDSFREYLALFGDDTTLLIDTYDTVTAAQRIVEAGLRPGSVRLDSGDLLQLSRQVRSVLDAGGLQSTRILVSGDLDEYRIAELLAAEAPIDGFGVGTAISAVGDAPALGAVYKLVETTEKGRRRPTAKRSPGKQTLPGRKQVWRLSRDGCAARDVLGLDSEAGLEGRPLLQCVMREGRRTRPAVPVGDIQRRCRQRVAELPPALHRLGDEPASYRVDISNELQALVRAT